MKRAAPFLLILLLAACSGLNQGLLPLAPTLTPESLITPTLETPTLAPPTSTPEPLDTSTPGPCYYVFDRPSGDQISRAVKSRLEAAGVPEVTVSSPSSGESCVYEDGTRAHNPTENNLTITIEDVDLANKHRLDDYTFKILTTLKPQTQTLAVEGEITLIFNASAPRIAVEVPYATIHALLEQHPTGEGLFDALRAN